MRGGYGVRPPANNFQSLWRRHASCVRQSRLALASSMSSWVAGALTDVLQKVLGSYVKGLDEAEALNISM